MRSLVSVEFGRRSISIEIMVWNWVVPTSKRRKPAKPIGTQEGESMVLIRSRGFGGYSVSTEACDLTYASKKLGETGGHAEKRSTRMRCPGFELWAFLINALEGYLRLTDSVSRRDLTSPRSS